MYVCVQVADKKETLSLTLIFTRKIDFRDVDRDDDCHSYLHAKIQFFLLKMHSFECLLVCRYIHVPPIFKQFLRSE